MSSVNDNSSIKDKKRKRSRGGQPSQTVGFKTGETFMNKDAKENNEPTIIDKMN